MQKQLLLGGMEFGRIVQLNARQLLESDIYSICQNTEPGLWHKFVTQWTKQCTRTHLGVTTFSSSAACIAIYKRQVYQQHGIQIYIKYLWIFASLSLPNRELKP